MLRATHWNLPVDVEGKKKKEGRIVGKKTCRKKHKCFNISDQKQKIKRMEETFEQMNDNRNLCFTRQEWGHFMSLQGKFQIGHADCDKICLILKLIRNSIYWINIFQFTIAQKGEYVCDYAGCAC